MIDRDAFARECRLWNEAYLLEQLARGPAGYAQGEYFAVIQAEVARRGLSSNGPSDTPSTSVLEEGKSVNWYLDVWRKSTDFEGRAARKEYWMFFLVNLIVAFVLALFDASNGITPKGNQSYLVAMYQLIVLLPSVAVAIRRMHDIDRSGWWSVVPIVNLVLAAREGTPGDNSYGPDPLAAARAQSPFGTDPSGATAPMGSSASDLGRFGLDLLVLLSIPLFLALCTLVWWQFWQHRH